MSHSERMLVTQEVFLVTGWPSFLQLTEEVAHSLGAIALDCDMQVPAAQCLIWQTLGYGVSQQR